MNICNFCNKEFSSSYSLKTHQKTAKFCLIKRNEEKNTLELSSKETSNESVNENTNHLYTCEFCNKICTTRYNLKSHSFSCKFKQENEIKQELTLKYKEEIEKYKQEIKFMQFEIEKLKEDNEILVVKHKQEILEYKQEINEYKNILFKIK